MDERTGEGGPPQALHPFAARPVLAVALALAGLLTGLSWRYGFHRDELYFLAAGDHPAWGYVDQPPLTPLIARAATAVFGDGPAGLRVPATLAAAATVVVLTLIARELGGTAPVQLLAAVCGSVSGLLLAVGHMVSTATFDLLAWLVVCWLVLRLLRTGDGRWWVPAGAAVGVGVLNKYLIALLVLVLLLSILATGPRRPVLRSGWLVAGGAVALLIALPNLWWQIDHNWPQWTVARGISEDDGGENRVMFVPLQLLYLSPLFVPVWVAGWLRLWRSAELRWARPFAVAYPLVCVVVLTVGGKAYYALPLLMVLLAAGCAPALAWSRRWLLVVAVVVTLAVNAVVTLPVLPPSKLSAAMAVNPEQGEQVGWPALVDTVAAGWAEIPPGQRAHAVVFTQNYGQAGAVVRFGASRGLPSAYSGHMAFADWGPPPDSQNGPVLIVHQDGDVGMLRFFTDCRETGRVDNGDNVDNEEQDASVVLCAGTTEPWSVLWPRLRHFY